MEYRLQRLGKVGNDKYIFWKIGPVCAIEQPLADDTSAWRYYDMEGYIDASNKLLKAHDKLIEQTKKKGK
jgi:hypothetical protein